ncbi:putative O-methyltransferase YrrM [Catalinimonas alkaloidigena]|uniref:O-methyltransferase n=1 Tax=Catalinimonas alkaloidigena TaxID=1075417 RepID=UPI0030B90504|nr:putative O-methyltransferase YrrM [Catalinimonas alkaloidigena]
MMNDSMIAGIPTALDLIEDKAKSIGFYMSSDRQVGSLLRTLVASKPKGNFLELGTGIGSSLSWIIEGMDKFSTVTSIDNDPDLVNFASEIFKSDQRVQLLCGDGSKWINEYSGEAFDLIFADAWPGKYSDLEKTLNMLKSGGFYVIDDMLSQSNWPDGHQEKVTMLIEQLEQRKDIHLTKMNWSTGLILATKI